jgi:hypothetical protein
VGQGTISATELGQVCRIPWVRGSPRAHPGITSAHRAPDGGESRHSTLTHQNTSKSVRLSLRAVLNPSPPSPSASREPGEPSPPQVSDLTLAHPCSPRLTRPHPPPSARPIDSPYAGPFWAPGQRGQNGLTRRCRFQAAPLAKGSRP